MLFLLFPIIWICLKGVQMKILNFTSVVSCIVAYTVVIISLGKMDFFYYVVHAWDVVVQYLRTDNTILDRYQTLLTGIIALGVGAVTIKHLREQINEEKAAKERLRLGKTFSYALEVEGYLQYVRHVFTGYQNYLKGRLSPAEIRYWEYAKKRILQRPRHTNGEIMSEVGIRDAHNIRYINGLITMLDSELNKHLKADDGIAHADPKWMKFMYDNLPEQLIKISDRINLFEGHDKITLSDVD